MCYTIPHSEEEIRHQHLYASHSHLLTARLRPVAPIVPIDPVVNSLLPHCYFIVFDMRRSNHIKTPALFSIAFIFCPYRIGMP